MAGPGPAPGGTPPGMPGPMPGAMMPPQMPPGGMLPPGMQPPMGAAPPGPVSGLAATIFQDLSADMPPHYQIFDAADRMMKIAIASGGFYKEPAQLAAARHIQSQTSRFIANYGRTANAMKGSMEAPAQVPDISETGSGDADLETGGE